MVIHVQPLWMDDILHHFENGKSLLVDIYVGIIIPWFAWWCEMALVHPQYWMCLKNSGPFPRVVGVLLVSYKWGLIKRPFTWDDTLGKTTKALIRLWDKLPNVQTGGPTWNMIDPGCLLLRLIKDPCIIHLNIAL